MNALPCCAIFLQRPIESGVCFYLREMVVVVPCELKALCLIFDFKSRENEPHFISYRPTRGRTNWTCGLLKQTVKPVLFVCVIIFGNKKQYGSKCMHNSPQQFSHAFLVSLEQRDFDQGRTLISRCLLFSFTVQVILP